MAKNTADTDSSVQPGATVEADVNGAPPGHQPLFMKDGTRLYVPEDRVVDVMHELGLITVKYDVEAARADLVAYVKALADTVESTTEECVKLGYIREEAELVMHEAVGKVRDSFGHWQRAIGAIVPTEARIAAGRVLKDETGELAGHPGLQRHEAVIDAYTPKEG